MTPATQSAAVQPAAPHSTDPSLRDLGVALQRWAAGSARVGVVRVLDRHGFGTVESGQIVAGTADGGIAGGVYRGTLDDVALPLVASAAAGPGVRSAHVAEGPAVAAGLACSGGATLLGHPLAADAAALLGAAFERGLPAALVTPADGMSALVLAGRELEHSAGALGDPAERAPASGPGRAGDVTGAAPDVTDVPDVTQAARAHARDRLRRGATLTERFDAAGVDVLLDLWVPVPSVLSVGSGAIGEALLAQARLLGWTARRETELDAARTAVAEFSDADVLVLLDHGPAFDVVLLEGLRRGRGFIGALGSRHTQSARRERMRAAGATDAQLAALHGPVGLDLGARTPQETAVSIVSQVIGARSGRGGAALEGAEGRIGG
ncbi:MAG: XdhC family protein [Pseudonocardia sp.]